MREAKHIHIIQESEQMFTRLQILLDLRQCIVDGEAEEEGHERVALLAPFMQLDVMPHTFAVDPLVARRLEVS